MNQNKRNQHPFFRVVSTSLIVFATLSITASNASADTTPDPMTEVREAVAKGDNARAESLCAKELQRLKALGTHDNKLAAAEIQMAAFLIDRKQGAEAEPLALEAVNIYAKTDGNPSLMYNFAVSVLAQTYELQEKWQQAEPIVAKIRQQQDKGTDPRIQAMVDERYLKIIQHIPGREEDAKQLQAQIKSIETKTEPTEELAKLQMESIKANLAQDYTKAERLSRQAVAKARTLYGVNDIRYGDSANALANALFGGKRFGEAELYFKQHLAIQKKLGSNQTGVTLLMIATCMEKQGRAQEAEELKKQMRQQNIAVMQKFDPKMAASFKKLEATVQANEKQLAAMKRSRSIEDTMMSLNMMAVKMAAEDYADANNGYFPARVDMGLVSYFRGGNAAKKQAGEAPTNPFTQAKEWPILGKFVPAATLETMPPGQMVPGSIEYCVSSNRRAFTVCGGGANGKALPGKNGKKTLVYSNR